jgi:hypothetical protein
MISWLCASKILFNKYQVLKKNLVYLRLIYSVVYNEQDLYSIGVQFESQSIHQLS